jgi:hypothetical protein
MTTSSTLTACPVRHHIAYFADSEGRLIEQSMWEGHKQLGACDLVKPYTKVKAKISAILQLLADRQMEPTIDNLLQVVNPARSGM